MDQPKRGCRIALVVGLLLAATEASPGATIRFRNRAVVSGPVVTLGDVADVFDPDPQAARLLESVTLRPAPPPGDELQIGFSTIRSRLQAQGFDRADLQFTGRSVVTVIRAKTAPGSEAQPVDRASPQASPRQLERAQQTVTAAIAGYLGIAESPEFGIEVRIDPADAPLLALRKPADLRISGGKPPWDAWQRLTVSLAGSPSVQNSRAAASVNVACRLVPHPSVPTVRRTVRRGEVLRRDDVVMQPVESPNGDRLRLEDVVGREAVYTLRPGRPIQADDIRTVPLVRRGDIVTVYSRAGGIVVKRDFKSRGDGSRGDRVTLISLDGGERVEATVVGYHEAEITPAGSAPLRRRPAYGGRIRFESSPRQLPVNTPAASEDLESGKRQVPEFVPLLARPR